MARVKPDLRQKVAEEYAKETSRITGAHIDGPPFMALLMNDRFVHKSSDRPRSARNSLSLLCSSGSSNGHTQADVDLCTGADPDCRS